MGDLLTYYYYVNVVMYTFFSVGMISDAKIFWGAGSPFCYFTVFDVSAEWFCKSVGTIIFFMNMAPFFAGLSYETYARISLPISLYQLPWFAQNAFYSTTNGPDGCTSPYAMPINLFVPQLGLVVVLLVWNVMALKQTNGGLSMSQAPKDGATYFCWAMALVYAVTFGTTLMISPKWFWGPDSIFCYWEVNDETGVFFGRMLGTIMVALYLSPLYAGLEYAKLAKVSLPINIFFLSYFAKAAFFMESIGPGPNALLPINLWVLQIPIGLFFLLWNIKALRNTKGATLMF